MPVCVEKEARACACTHASRQAPLHSSKRPAHACSIPASGQRVLESQTVTPTACPTETVSQSRDLTQRT